jgi:hypothetical protein
LKGEKFTADYAKIFPRKGKRQEKFPSIPESIRPRRSPR